MSKEELINTLKKNFENAFITFDNLSCNGETDTNNYNTMMQEIVNKQLSNFASSKSALSKLASYKKEPINLTFFKLAFLKFVL